MTLTSRPPVVGAWLRNIEPNLPAPISATRTGRAAAARSRSWSWIYTARSGRRFGEREFGDAVVSERLDGRKSRWATHSGRLKRRMWLSTWQSER